MSLDAPRSPGSREADEAEALSLIAQVMRDQRTPAAITHDVWRQTSEVLQTVAIELNASRAVPTGVRRSVRGLANALRQALDPNDGPSEP